MLRALREPLYDRKTIVENKYSDIVLTFFQDPASRLVAPQEFNMSSLAISVFSPDTENERRFWHSGDVEFSYHNNVPLTIPLSIFNIMLTDEMQEPMAVLATQLINDKNIIGLPRFVRIDDQNNKLSNVIAPERDGSYPYHPVLLMRLDMSRFIKPLKLEISVFICGIKYKLV